MKKKIKELSKVTTTDISNESEYTPIVFVNNPITDRDHDVIGFNTQVDTLQRAIDDGATMIGIIADYGTFIDVIKKQEVEKDKLAEEIIRLKKQLRDATVDMEIAKASTTANNTAINNVDILKRISNLEKVIFGNKE